MALVFSVGVVVAMALLVVDAAAVGLVGTVDSGLGEVLIVGCAAGEELRAPGLETIFRRL